LEKSVGNNCKACGRTEGRIHKKENHFAEFDAKIKSSTMKRKKEGVTKILEGNKVQLRNTK
jgi:hypothetical protein